MSNLIKFKTGRYRWKQSQDGCTGCAGESDQELCTAMADHCRGQILISLPVILCKACERNRASDYDGLCTLCRGCTAAEQKKIDAELKAKWKD